MSNSTVANRAVARTLPELRSSSGAGGAGDMYRLRQIHMAYGGRIRASWQSILTIAPFGKASTAGGSNGSLGDRGGGQRSLSGGCGYSWAIVRTRGGLGDNGQERDGVASGGITDTSNPSSRVIQQGSVSPGGILCTEEGGGTTDNSKTKVAVDPSSDLSSSTVSPLRWHFFEVDTTDWLPGDLLSLWIRLYDVAGDWCSETAPAPAEETARRGGEIRQDFPLSHQPRVRGFELEVVDDAAAEETARRSRCILRRKRHHPALASSSSSNRLNGGEVKEGESAAAATDLTCSGRVNRAVGFGEAAAECYFAPAFSATAPGPGTSVDTVQLDFAAVCPMNMAAAGGSWA